jgi:sodium/proline symporter
MLAKQVGTAMCRGRGMKILTNPIKLRMLPLAMQVWILFAFLIYFTVLLCIGLTFHKRLKSSADFMLGNRSLTFWLTALTAHASDMSAWLFMAFPAALYIQGMSGWWIALGLIAGMFLNWQFIAKPLRIQTEKHHTYTLANYFERHFEDPTGTIRILTSIMAVGYLSIYLGAGLYAMGLIFTSVFGLNFYMSLLIATTVAMTYVFFGGFLTVAWTDFFQGLYLLAVLLIVAFKAFYHLPGGLSALQSTAAARGISHDNSFYELLMTVFLILGWGLGYYGQPHIITKFMGIRKPNEIIKAKYLGLTWQTLSLGAAGLIGLMGLSYFPEGLPNPELVFVDLVKLLFNPFAVGFILCGIIAANMSTMDSQILVTASALSGDFYKHLLNPQATSAQILKAVRYAVVLVSIAALLVAYLTTSSILNMVLYAWSGLGSSFGPLVIMSLYDPKANRYGAIAGLLLGGVISGFWPLLNPHITDMPIPSMIPGFFSALAGIYLVSRLTKET